jgi:hypothetical protein
MEGLHSSGTVSCRVFGHRFLFTSEDQRMVWQCSRCGAGDAKDYPTPAEAGRFANALDVRSTDSLGKRAPLVGLLPLRGWRRWRDRT